jgi:PleD family two-component response regulator
MLLHHRLTDHRLDLMIIALVTLSAQQLRHRRVAEDKLRELPRADGLTGSNNRRAFDEVVQEE